MTAEVDELVDGQAGFFAELAGRCNRRSLAFVHQARREFQRCAPQDGPELADDRNQSAGGARTHHDIIGDLKAMVGLHRFAVSADGDFDERHPRRQDIDAAAFDGLPFAGHVGRPLPGRSSLAQLRRLDV